MPRPGAGGALERGTFDHSMRGVAGTGRGQMTPWASIASATFTKPAMLAPTT